MRIVVALAALLALTGCYCVPEKNESVDWDYGSNCWSTAKGQKTRR